MKQYIVDAFTDKLFAGNQAAVCVMDAWPAESLMINITKENNFSETAFAVRRDVAAEKSDTCGYDLRWFTPGEEINLCGHATLATAYVLFRFYEPEVKNVTFHTLSGDLFVGKDGERIVMDFPAYHCRQVPVTPQMGEAIGQERYSRFSSLRANRRALVPRTGRARGHRWQGCTLFRR